MEIFIIKKKIAILSNVNLCIRCGFFLFFRTTRERARGRPTKTSLFRHNVSIIWKNTYKYLLTEWNKSWSVPQDISGGSIFFFSILYVIYGVFDDNYIFYSAFRSKMNFVKKNRLVSRRLLRKYQRLLYIEHHRCTARSMTYYKRQKLYIRDVWKLKKNINWNEHGFCVTTFRMSYDSNWLKEKTRVFPHILSSKYYCVWYFIHLLLCQKQKYSI